tara:strand:+ start:1023 stop:1361 length:339 start_codon:yes stop_codon:yes gene_type:complete
MIKAILCLLLVGSLTARNYEFGARKSQEPIPVKDFRLEYHDIPDGVTNLIGKVVAVFEIDEHGNVLDPYVQDTFNIKLNHIIVNKLKQTKYQPAIQNGRPVRVRMTLPIVFK